MNRIKHSRSIVAAALAAGLGLASGGAMADIEAIKITEMPKQEVPGAHTIVDNRGAVVVENEHGETRSDEVAENTIGGRAGSLQRPESSK